MTVPEVVDLGFGFLEPGQRYFHGFDLGGFEVVLGDAGWRVVILKQRFVTLENQSLGPTGRSRSRGSRSIRRMS